ncbi:amino acid/polyamine transporter I [Dactylonectria macrodidyma]|uniref:Amino acid/polyamine transporter I n=1 Tax=Dactylonectria macrodidyma TaxID=307937 RepID=A0A9P9JMJ3_9HYPO|nr:amino acid/polyamine transporter I [Dactylonectria macrodidyma]
MEIGRESRELSDMRPSKTPEPRIETITEDFDTEQLARLGKKSILVRNFNYLTILGFSCAILTTWEATLTSLAPGLANGGPAGLIYGFIFVWIGNISVFSTLCELVSIAPTSGGQYHWVAMLAPRSCSRFLSYITGWLTLAGWQGTCAGAAFLAATQIQGLVAFMTPSYNPQSWQGSLMLCLCILIGIFVNTVVSSMLPSLEGMFLVVHILGFFSILVPLVTFGSHGGDTSSMFLEFRNQGMWPSQGLSCFVGLLGAVFAFAGVDCSFHMCEEVRDASRVVPRSIMISILINGAMGFTTIIAVLYSSIDIDKAIASPTGYPYIEIFYQAVGSKGGAAAMSSLIIFMTMSAVIGITTATSRVLWAFARDRGLPFWSSLSKVHSRTHIPVWALAITTIVSCLIGLINIGSTVVFYAIISLSVSSLYSSYLIAACLLLYRRCGKGYKMPDPTALPALADTNAGEGQSLVWGPWHIPGILGIINNGFGCLFIIFVWFFSFWPPATPVTPSTVNYAPLMTGGVVVISIIYYLLWAKKEYKGPRMEI